MSHLSGGVTANVDQPVRPELEQLSQEQLITAFPAEPKDSGREQPMGISASARVLPQRENASEGKIDSSPWYV